MCVEANKGRECCINGTSAISVKGHQGAARLFPLTRAQAESIDVKIIFFRC